MQTEVEATLTTKNRENLPWGNQGLSIAALSTVASTCFSVCFLLGCELHEFGTFPQDAQFLLGPSITGWVLQSSG